MASADTPPDIVPYTILFGEGAPEIPARLTAAPGDPELGRAVYWDPGRGGCAVCHGEPGGRPGPSGGLGEVAARRSAGALRLWIVAPQASRPGTAMPAYFAAGQRQDPQDPLYGGPRLTAAEIEGLVAYLLGVSAAAGAAAPEPGDATGPSAPNP